MALPFVSAASVLAPLLTSRSEDSDTTRVDPTKGRTHGGVGGWRRGSSGRMHNHEYLIVFAKGCQVPGPNAAGLESVGKSHILQPAA
jgi:hypothetical protein